MVSYASIFAKKYGTLVRYAFFVVVRVCYASKIELMYGMLGWYGSRFEVRSMQILNVPYCHPWYCVILIISTQDNDLS